VFAQKALAAQDPLDEIKPKCLSSCQDWMPDAQDNAHYAKHAPRMG
jgi:hypothetical protein